MKVKNLSFRTSMSYSKRPVHSTIHIQNTPTPHTSVLSMHSVDTDLYYLTISNLCGFQIEHLKTNQAQELDQ